MVITNPNSAAENVPARSLAPVGQDGIEDLLQQGHILGLQALVRSLRVSRQAGPERGWVVT